MLRQQYRARLPFNHKLVECGSIHQSQCVGKGSRTPVATAQAGWQLTGQRLFTQSSVPLDHQIHPCFPTQTQSQLIRITRVSRWLKRQEREEVCVLGSSLLIVWHLLLAVIFASMTWILRLRDGKQRKPEVTQLVSGGSVFRKQIC